MTTLAEHMIVVGAENRPPMIDKTMYNSWQSRMLLYIKGKKNGRMMLESIENGHLLYPTMCIPLSTIVKRLKKFGIESSYLCKALNYHIKKELFLYNDRRLDRIICQDVKNIVMHADSVPVNMLSADNKCLMNDNLEIERLEQENDHLFILFLSQETVHICVNYLASRKDCHEMQQGFIHEYNANLMLKAELAKKGHMVEKKFFDEVEKNVVEKDVKPNNPKVIAPGMFKLDLEPLAPKVLKNRDAHLDYIKHSREHANTLWEIVEHSRALKPLDRDLNFAFGALCYPTNDSEDLGKLKPKADIGIIVGYALAKKAF
ncbi:hypothetical protein Tco_0156074 [Tanacetum coccineum]